MIYEYDFIGFGALNVDIFYSILPSKQLSDIVTNLSPGGERVGTESERKTIIENAQNHSKITGKSGGGQSANTAVALAQMGFKCGFIGKVGNDELGDLILDSMENLDKSHIQREGNSGTCLCLLSDNGERANIVFPGCNDTISINDSHVDYTKTARFLHLTSFCSEEVLKAQEWLIKHDLGKTMVTFDPGEIYCRLGIDRLCDVLKRTDILFITSQELELMTGKQYQLAIKQVIDCGTSIIVCKMGELGSRIISKETDIYIPITKVEKVIDKTGAGDVYASGFIAGLIYGLPLELCGKLASIASALSITAYGREKYPDKEFFDKWIDNNFNE